MEIATILNSIRLEQVLDSIWSDEYYNSIGTIKAANLVVLGRQGAAIGKTKKMNCFSWGISTEHCKTGRILSKDPDNSCNGCYAKHGNYMFASPKRCMKDRLEHLDQPRWSEAITLLINRRNKEKGQFRWFDSGDLQHHDHLLKIIQVCEHSPQVKHWLPTQEHTLILEHVVGNWEVPSNLTIRLSAVKKNGPPPTELANYLNSFPNVKGFIGTSNVGVTKVWKESKDKCPSSLHGGQCKTCTKCWAPVANVMYKKH
jgi:hypothetical protein